MPNDPARFSPYSLLIAFRAARRSRWRSGRRLHPDQSSPKTLTVAVGALPRILYWIFVHVRRPLRPGASVGAVCPLYEHLHAMPYEEAVHMAAKLAADLRAE